MTVGKTWENHGFLDLVNGYNLKRELLVHPTFLLSHPNFKLHIRMQLEKNEVQEVVLFKK